MYLNRRRVRHSQKNHPNASRKPRTGWTCKWPCFWAISKTVMKCESMERALSQPNVRPPSRMRIWPVINLEWTRKETASATSSAVPVRWRGAVRDIARPGEDAADVGEIDDDTARLLEQRSGGLGAEERRFQIGV